MLNPINVMDGLVFPHVTIDPNKFVEYYIPFIDRFLFDVALIQVADLSTHFMSYTLICPRYLF